MAIMAGWNALLRVGTTAVDGVGTFFSMNDGRVRALDCRTAGVSFSTPSLQLAVDMMPHITAEPLIPTFSPPRAQGAGLERMRGMICYH